MRKLVRRISEALGINLGNKEGNEIKGFIPYPVLKVGILDQEWDVGLPWYLKRLHGQVVVDCGFISHQNFTRLLASLGYTVYGVDIDDFPDTFPNFKHIQCPVWGVPLSERSVDVIIANSLLEHIGLAFYNQPHTSYAEAETMNQLHRLLKPSGRLLMQVPYVKKTAEIKHRGREFYRTYTRKTLTKLLGKFYIEEKTFYAKAQKGWVEVSENVADRVEQGGGFPVCLCYIEARRI